MSKLLNNRSRLLLCLPLSRRNRCSSLKLLPLSRLSRKFRLLNLNRLSLRKLLPRPLKLPYQKPTQFSTLEPHPSRTSSAEDN